jgi:hypothetical protein
MSVYLIDELLSNIVVFDAVVLTRSYEASTSGALLPFGCAVVLETSWSKGDDVLTSWFVGDDVVRFCFVGLEVLVSWLMRTDGLTSCFTEDDDSIIMFSDVEFCSGEAVAELYFSGWLAVNSTICKFFVCFSFPLAVMAATGTFVVGSCISVE